MSFALVRGYGPAASFILALAVACGPKAPATADPALVHGPDDPDHDEPQVMADDDEGDDGDGSDAVVHAVAPRPPQVIYRSEIDRALAGGPASLLRALGPEPFRHQGRFVGWELTRVFPDDPRLCAPGCDIALGDIILSVNGSRLQTPQELTALLETLPDARTLVVTSLRNERRRQVTYTIVEDRDGR